MGGGGFSGGGGWEAVGGLKQTFKLKGQCCAISNDPDWHNLQGRPGLLLESVWQPIHSYKYPSGPQRL